MIGTTYLLRVPGDPDRYSETANTSDALRRSLERTTCDECDQPVTWATRSVVVTGSRIDHQTVYLTVLCPRCLPIVAERIG